MTIEITAWPALGAAVGTMFVLGMLAGLRLSERRWRRTSTRLAQLRREVASARRRLAAEATRRPDSVDLLDPDED